MPLWIPLTTAAAFLQNLQAPLELAGCLVIAASILTLGAAT